MASTFTTLLRFEKQGTGENDDTWGSRLNTLIDLLEHSVARREIIALASTTPVTLTTSNGAADQARCLCLAFEGTLTANIAVHVPALSKFYIVTNTCTGAFTVTVKTAAGSGVVVAQGGTPVLVYCDGTNVKSVQPSSGPGSGFDADTVDGVHAAALAEIAQARTISGLWNYTTPPTINGLTVGYLEVPQNSQSAAYGLLAADAGKHIYHPSADTTPRIWTIPAHASIPYPRGTAITFVNDVSAGTITIAITSDTLVLAGSGAAGPRTLAAGNMATAIKVGDTRWMISGSAGLT